LHWLVFLTKDHANNLIPPQTQPFLLYKWKICLHLYRLIYSVFMPVEKSRPTMLRYYKDELCHKGDSNNRNIAFMRMATTQATG